MQTVPMFRSQIRSPEDTLGSLHPFVMAILDDEKQPPEKKRRPMKYDAFKRLQSEFDPEMQMLTWLDSDCELAVFKLESDGDSGECMGRLEVLLHLAHTSLLQR